MDMFTDSDSESYAESTDTDDYDGLGSAYSGHAQSIFSCLDESIEKIDDFLAFQRGFLHGDIVSSINDPLKQLGRVVDVDMSVDLETNLGQLIEGVSSKKLARIHAFSSGDYVIHGPWLGIVRRVVERVTVLLNNGSKCEILVEDSDDLIPTSPSLFEDGSHPLYYLGQDVSIKNHSAYENTKWLCGSWKGGRTEGTICHIEVGLINVKWIASFMCLGSIPSPPDRVQDPNVLTLLPCFSYTNWQIGDYCTLPNDYNHYSKMADKEHHSGVRYQLCHELFSIGKIRIKVDVSWQNGQVSVGVEPETLLPVSSIGDHDFWPGQFVMEKVASGDVQQSNARILGVVKSVESLEQIVRVKWIASELGQTDNFNGDMEEIVSAYELVEHPDASFSLGDIVARFQNCDNVEGSISNSQFKTGQNREQKSIPISTATSLLQLNDCKKNVCSCDHDDCATSFASHIGIVTAFKEESVEVRWASGVISKVHPYEVFCLDRLDEIESSSTVHQDVEYVQNEMVGNVNQSQHDKEVVNSFNGGSNRAFWDADVLSLPIAAFRFLKKMAERIFSISYSSSPSCEKLSDFTYLDKIGECSLSPGSSLTRDKLQLVDGDPHGLHTSENKMTSMGDDELQFEEQMEVVKCGAEQNKISIFVAGCRKSERFKQFDCVIDYSDHHFANIISKDVVKSQVKSTWLKRVQQEWNILKEDLPEGICVRVYEERVDLLRASIAGQSGTPYYHGLFFFDIHLSENYPQEPPHVHYHSGGLRLNPNLYESGKICLSLLNTWTGNGTELWNPNNSTILQVLVSLQALVLNENPYFNEAGYEEQIGRADAERNSINYNENAFLLTCKSMMYILRQPPKHFEALVEEHFTERAHDIICACKAYMDGARVGSYGSGTGSTNGGRSNSAGFKIMLAKIFPAIISSFTEKGIDCSQFIDQSS